MKILMVCLGNICRSPLAHGILEHKVQQQQLDWEVDSCGTGGWHAGEKPDMRSRAIAQETASTSMRSVLAKLQPMTLPTSI